VKLDKLKLRGFRGIKAGLNKDEIEIDFSGLSGLVALAGDNGKGKTTVLENCQPFRLMPSRKSSLYRQVFLRDSYKDLSFWFEGVHYRTLVKIDPQAEKSEGYIWKNHNNKKSEVDGKVSNYDSYLTDLLGSSNLFFNSIFAAQNSKKISDLTTGKLQGLFSEFLRLYELVSHEATSKQCITVLGTITTRIDREIDALKVKIMDKAETERNLSETVEKEGVYSKERIELVEKIKKAEASCELVKEAIAKSLVKKGRLKDLEQNVTRLTQDQDRERESVESELSRLRPMLHEIIDDLAQCEALFADKDKIIDACKREAEILERIPAVEKELDQRQKCIDKNKIEIDALNSATNEQRRIIDAGKKDPEVARLETEIRGKREKTTDLEKRDPECTSEICSFIVGALEAHKQLPVLEKEFSERHEAILVQRRKAEADLVVLANQLVAILKEQKDELKKHKALKEEKKRLDDDLRQARLLSVKKPQIEIATVRKSDLEKRKDEVTSEGVRFRDNRDKAIARIEDEIKKLNIEITDLKSTIDNSLDEKKAEFERQIKESQLVLENMDKQITDVKEKIAVLKQSIIEKIVAEKDLATQNDERTRLLHEQSEWIYLRNACSKDGLRQLEFDSVAPVISGYTNELLSMSSFESNDLVKFRTQDEDGREDIKIIVLREEEVLLDDLCGGEEVWILKALRLAMTLISKEKSGKRYESIFCDEEDGSLSVENAKKFIYLYKSLMQIGDIDTCFYISHKTEAVALANHVLHFEYGGIEIQ
jgi:exonuclease SbcC